MNGVHDVGGMHGFGPIHPEANEPVFHARWEGRIMAMNLAVAAWRRFGVDTRRAAREMIPPADQLALSYYERWYLGLVKNLVDFGMITSAELSAGKPDPGAAKMTPALAAAMAPAFWNNGAPKNRNVPAVARFHVGQRVKARVINPQTHTRLPRYARGKLGAIEAAHGVFVFPDTSAQGLGEKPQHLYSVRFSARELWGERAGVRDSVCIDMWDDYLEPA